MQLTTTCIPPATQTFDSLYFFGRSFDCNSSQFDLPEFNDGMISSSSDCQMLSSTRAWPYDMWIIVVLRRCKLTINEKEKIEWCIKIIYLQVIQKS